MGTLSLAAAAHSHPRRPAWIGEGRTVTFGEAWTLASNASAKLARDGVRAGDRVALLAEPSIETLVALFGIAATGATVVPLHPRLTPEERRAQVAAAAPAAVLDTRAIRALANARRPRGDTAVWKQPSPFALMFTSGSSGAPKGVLLPSRAFLASAAATAELAPFSTLDRWLLCMPLAHVGGLSIVTRSLLARRSIVVEPGFDPPRVLAAVARERVTRISVVPTMLDALLREDRGGRLARLRLVLVGGAACPPALLEECAWRGILVRTTYGLTEACSMVTLQRSLSRAGGEGCGPAIPGMEIRIRRESGATCVAGEEGRIAIRGGAMMNGYLGEKPLPPGKWFDTGDLGRLDASGNLIVAARRTDLIVTGGENVSPIEVERVLETVAGVRQALVFGVPDARWGQVVAAALVTDPRRPPRESALRVEIAKRLATFKRPRRLCFVDALPRLPSGKPDRVRAATALGGALRSFAC